eukprot:3531814-Karenia_brevis.AAC.1
MDAEISNGVVAMVSCAWAQELVELSFATSMRRHLFLEGWKIMPLLMARQFPLPNHASTSDLFMNLDRTPASCSSMHMEKIR